jgi:zinc protease
MITQDPLSIKLKKYIKIASILIGITSIICVNNQIYANTNTAETTLSNGLKIIVREDHRSPVIISQIWYKVGSSYEPNGITGISHMLEHMMFKATKNLKDGEFTEIIAKKGGQQNAFTSTDFTAYYQNLSKQHLETSFKLEAERMQNLLLDPAVFDKERQVVIEERRLRIEDDPITYTSERLKAAANISSPYHHPVIGWPDDLKNYQLSDLLNWYKKWYAPNNAIIVVVGDVQPKDVFTLAEKYFGKIKPKDIPAIKSKKEVIALGERNITVKLPAKLPALFMAYNVPSIKTASDKQDVYALEVIQSILALGNSSRFSKILEREKELVVSASTNYEVFDLHDTLFIINAIPTPSNSVSQIKAAILEQLNNLKTTEVTTSELDRVKAFLIANKVYEQDSISYQAMTIGALESLDLKWQDYDHYIEQLKRISPEQIKNTAQKYFTDEKLTTAVLEPQKIAVKNK